MLRRTCLRLFRCRHCGRMALRCATGHARPSLALHHCAQIAQCLDACNGIVLQLQAQPMLKRRLQLHSAQAVQMQILREPKPGIVA